MDHIPLEIHMGLEIKGELPDKLHCTLLSTNYLNNGLNFFSPKFWKSWVCPTDILTNPMGLEFFGFENHVTCQGQPLHPLLLCPSLHHAYECTVIKMETSLRKWKKWGAGRGCYWFFFSSSFSVTFLALLHLFLFNLFILHFFFILLSLFPIPTFCSSSLKHKNG